MPGAHSIERYLAEEGVGVVINAHYKDRKEWYVHTTVEHSVLVKY